MEVDISNKTIVVLVVLTVIISVLSTMVVLTEVSNMKMDSFKTKTVTSSGNVGQVSLEITPAKQVMAGTGQVTLKVLPRE